MVGIRLPPDIRQDLTLRLLVVAVVVGSNIHHTARDYPLLLLLGRLLRRSLGRPGNVAACRNKDMDTEDNRKGKHRTQTGLEKDGVCCCRGASPRRPLDMETVLLLPAGFVVGLRQEEGGIPPEAVTPLPDGRLLLVFVVLPAFPGPHFCAIPPWPFCTLGEVHIPFQYVCFVAPVGRLSTFVPVSWIFLHSQWSGALS